MYQINKQKGVMKKMELKYESPNIAKDHPIIVKLGDAGLMLVASLLFIIGAISTIFLNNDILAMAFSTDVKESLNTSALAIVGYMLMGLSFALLVCITLIRVKALGYSQRLVYESDAVIQDISPKVTSGVRMVTIEAENQVYAIEKTDAEVAKLRQGDVVKLELRVERTPYDSHKTKDFIDIQERNKKKLPIDDIEIKEHIIIKEA